MAREDDTSWYNVWTDVKRLLENRKSTSTMCRARSARPSTTMAPCLSPITRPAKMKRTSAPIQRPSRRPAENSRRLTTSQSAAILCSRTPRCLKSALGQRRANKSSLEHVGDGMTTASNDSRTEGKRDGELGGLADVAKEDHCGKGG